ncbi:MAG: hypothetical protein QXG73_03805 [Candidatus Micrarchaeaceae archaeon]
MKTIYSLTGYNGKGFRIRLLSRREAQKRGLGKGGVDRILFEIMRNGRVEGWHAFQLFEAAAVAAGLSLAASELEGSRLYNRREKERKIKKVL